MKTELLSYSPEPTDPLILLGLTGSEELISIATSWSDCLEPPAFVKLILKNIFDLHDVQLA